MLYLLDANVLIDANRDYYPIERIPEFWDWLVYQGTQTNLKIPVETYEEIKDGDDELVTWLKQQTVQDALLLEGEVDVALVTRAVTEGYAPDLTDDELLRLGRDPFLIAHALVSVGTIVVVTTEGSRPSRQRANRHLPDVCAHFGVDACNTFELVRRLNFTTQWRLPSTS